MYLREVQGQKQIKKARQEVKMRQNRKAFPSKAKNEIKTNASFVHKNPRSLHRNFSDGSKNVCYFTGFMTSFLAAKSSDACEQPFKGVLKTVPLLLMIAKCKAKIGQIRSN